MRPPDDVPSPARRKRSLLQIGAQRRPALEILCSHVRSLLGKKSDEARPFRADHGEGVRRASGNGDGLVLANEKALVSNPQVERSFDDNNHLIDFLMEMQWCPSPLFQDAHA